MDTHLMNTVEGRRVAWSIYLSDKTRVPAASGPADFLGRIFLEDGVKPRNQLQPLVSKTASAACMRNVFK